MHIYGIIREQVASNSQKPGNIHTHTNTHVRAEESKIIKYVAAM